MKVQLTIRVDVVVGMTVEAEALRHNLTLPQYVVRLIEADAERLTRERQNQPQPPRPMQPPADSTPPRPTAPHPQGREWFYNGFAGRWE